MSLVCPCVLVVSMEEVVEEDRRPGRWSGVLRLFMHVGSPCDVALRLYLLPLSVSVPLSVAFGLVTSYYGTRVSSVTASLLDLP